MRFRRHSSQDKTSRVAAETLVKDNMVVLAGEITTGARVNFSEVVRKTVKRIGYNDPTIGFDTHTCTVIVAYGEQSQNIAQGVDEGKGWTWSKALETRVSCSAMHATRRRN